MVSVVLMTGDQISKQNKIIFFSFSEPITPVNNRIITNNNCSKAINGNIPLITYSSMTPPGPGTIVHHQQSPKTPTAMPPSGADDGNVLKKIITLSVEQFNNVENSMGKTMASVSKTNTRPAFVPEKLHFSAYEQFEGEFIVRYRFVFKFYHVPADISSINT